MEAAGSISEQPKRLMQVFKNTELSESGIYALTLYALQVPITIVIDDFLPINRAIELMAGKVGIDGSLWGLLLEKAVAKLHGDYHALISGSIN